MFRVDKPGEFFQGFSSWQESEETIEHCQNHSSFGVCAFRVFKRELGQSFWIESGLRKDRQRRVVIQLQLRDVFLEEEVKHYFTFWWYACTLKATTEFWPIFNLVCDWLKIEILFWCFVFWPILSSTLLKRVNLTRTSYEDFILSYH